jgi:hypothetical protein
MSKLKRWSVRIALVLVTAGLVAPAWAAMPGLVHGTGQSASYLADPDPDPDNHMQE